jgi:hypothetical protein
LDAWYPIAKVIITTTVIELKGMRMAAMRGVSHPDTAKDIPTTL